MTLTATNEAEIYLSQWNDSYERMENHLFYPKEEVVKFLNRFVRKKIGENQFIDILDFSKPIRALDFGCGIGRQTLLLHEFGLETVGVDISEHAIQTAKKMAFEQGLKSLVSRFQIINGQKIPFDQHYFDITICESVLDSMHFEIAKTIMNDICSVTKQLIFASFIYENDYAGEKVVTTEHEKGTIQSYFTLSKIQELIAATQFKIHYCHLVTDKNMLTNDSNSRFFVVFKKSE